MAPAKQVRRPLAGHVLLRLEREWAAESVAKL